MNIIWNKNPLNTVVELDEHDIEVLKLKIRIEEYEDMLFGAHWNLTRTEEYLAKLPRPQTLEEARAAALKELDPDYWCGDGDTKLDERIKTLIEHYIEELKGTHVGDCTCVPCSCSKCHAESLLGIDTIKGVGKHSLYKIDSAFGPNNERTLDEAIAHLENYEPELKPGSGWKSQEAFDAHVPRWKAEAAQALTWLKNYKEEHAAALQSGISRQIAPHTEAATTGDAGSIPSSN